MKSLKRAEFGDFQTPLGLAQAVCELITAQHVTPDVVVEPTCGIGAFLAAAADVFPGAQLCGWDISSAHLERARKALGDPDASGRLRLVCQDFFECDWEHELRSLPGKLLILGNLPWVTNSAVSAMNGSNLPQKENFMGLRGMAAITGKSNFDISEWMLIRLLRPLNGRAATIAMLCKTAAARKFLRYAWQNDSPVSSAALYRIDAALHFEAAVDACLLIVSTGTTGPHEADVYDSLEAPKPSGRIGLAGKDLVADIRAYRKLRHLEGLCPHRWRSGIKHDCAAVMELRGISEERLENSLGERVDVESDYLYPLLKCTDLFHGRVTPAKWILVTQQKVGEDTSLIEHKAPHTWTYLTSHIERFEARKSSIYRGKPAFCLFGIGDYAFAPWKVAVSGLHHSARFTVIPPFRGKPVMLDDTCYYLSFSSPEDARLVCEVLNSVPCQSFLKALVFPDAKRSLTVDLLQRLNLNAVAEEAGLDAEWRQMSHVRFRAPEFASQLELVMETPTAYTVKSKLVRKK